MVSTTKTGTQGTPPLKAVPRPNTSRIPRCSTRVTVRMTHTSTPTASHTGTRRGGRASRRVVSGTWRGACVGRASYGIACCVGCGFGAGCAGGARWMLCRGVFFFQAEDGIRDLIVTGVQTCALPISSRRRHTRSDRDWSSDVCSSDRSEEHTSELQSRSDLVCRLLLEIGRASCRERARLNSSHDQISYAVFCLRDLIVTGVQT